MRRLGINLLAAVVLAVAAVGASAQPGTWVWTLDVDSKTSSLVFTGVAGSSQPITITGSVFNNDPSHPLSFDGVTLKTDDLFPPDPSVFQSLWRVDPSVEMPESFILPGNGKKRGVVIGHFDLSNAQPGTYKFRLVASGSYDAVQPNPPDSVSALITVNVVPVVPEPASAGVLLAGVISFTSMVRRRSRL